MTQFQLIADIADDLVLAAFFAALLFIVSYTIMAPWWRHQISTSLVVVDTGLMLTLGPDAAHRLFGVTITTQLWYGWYLCASLALVAAGVLWRTAVMFRANWDTPRTLRIRAAVRGWVAFIRYWMLAR